MAMKKKFLGLAMAAAMTIPATNVFAATNQTIQGDNTEELNATVAVKGSVAKADGTAPAGKIQVELPTAMAFTVDKNGTFVAPTYDVKNQGGDGIEVSVDSFTESNKGTGIEIKSMDQLADTSTLTRDNVAIELRGNGGTVDLGKISTGDKSATKVLTIDSNSSQTLSLTGKSGTKKGDASQAGVDRDGATENFSLVFKIKKVDSHA